MANTVGRVFTGWLADLRKVGSLDITYLSIYVCGLSTAAFPFCTSYALLCLAACVFGLSVGQCLLGPLEVIIVTVVVIDFFWGGGGGRVCSVARASTTCLRT